MWEACKDAIFWVINFFFNMVGDWGLAIIIITVIFRALITPLMHSQAKSSYMTNKLQPKLNAVKQKFADDPVRQQEETQKIYAEAKFNPLMGCVPMLIQLPIFMALFQVLRAMDKYITGTGDICFYNVVPDLIATPHEMWATGGFMPALPYVILLIIFAVATFVPMLLQQIQNKNQQQNNSMMIMMVFMTIMMLFIGWSSPAGVLLFWGVSSLLAIAQQQISLRIIKKKDREEEERREALRALQPVEVDVERRVQKKRQKKKR